MIYLKEIHLATAQIPVLSFTSLETAGSQNCGINRSGTYNNYSIISFPGLTAEYLKRLIQMVCRCLLNI